MFKRTSLSNVQVGTVVLYERALGFQSNKEYYLKTVTHTTKTQIVIGDKRFSRSTGRERRDTYHRDCIYALMPENKEEAEQLAEETRHKKRIKNIALLSYRLSLEGCST